VIALTRRGFAILTAILRTSFLLSSLLPSGDRVRFHNISLDFIGADGGKRAACAKVPEKSKLANS
jgi:hypothetical protein